MFKNNLSGKGWEKRSGWRSRVAMSNLEITFHFFLNLQLCKIVMFAGWECKTLPIIKIRVVDVGSGKNGGKLVFLSGGGMIEWGFFF